MLNNLIKPFHLNEEEDMDSAFERFKDSHLQKQAIEEKDNVIHIKERQK